MHPYMIRWPRGYNGGQTYPYCPAISPPARDYLPLKPDRGEVLPSARIGTQDKTKIEADLHVETPHHMQKLDETHCKALHRISSQKMPDKYRRYGIALASARRTFGSWKLVMIAAEKKVNTRPEEVEETVGRRRGGGLKQREY